MPKTNSRTLARQAAESERRRTKRVPLSFQIEVSGRDHTGAAFREHAITRDVNHNGCKFDLLWELKPDDLIGISVIRKEPRSAASEEPATFRVVWVEPSQLGWTIGATALKDKNIWHMAFPLKE